jgi:hypothetical protein
MLCTAGSSVRLWSIPHSIPTLTLNLPLPLVHSVAFSPDGTLLLTTGNSPTVYITDLVSGEINAIETDCETISASSFSPDGEKWAIGSPTGRIRVFSTITMTRIGGHKAHKASVTCIAFTPNSDAVLGGDTANKISTAAFTKAEMLRLWRTAWGPVHCIVPSPYYDSNNRENDLLAIGSGDCLRLYQGKSDPKIIAFDCGEVSIIRFSPANKAEIGFTVGSTLIWLNVEEGTEIERIQFSDKIVGFDWRSLGSGKIIDIVIALSNGELFGLNSSDLDHRTILCSDPRDLILTLKFQPNAIKISQRLLPQKKKSKALTDLETAERNEMPKRESPRKTEKKVFFQSPTLVNHDSPRRAVPPPPPDPFPPPRSRSPPPQPKDVDLLEDVDLSHLSPENRDLVRAIAININETAEQLKEEFTQHINAVHLDLLCRIRQLADRLEKSKL